MTDISQSRLATLRANSGWLVAFGAVFIALGLLALGSVVTATIVTVYFVGVIMIVAGVAEIGMALRAKSWSGFLVWMFLGVVYSVGGIFAFVNPLLTAGTLTLFLGAALVASGLMRIYLALQMRAGSAWGWVVVSGAITALLGFSILANWPFSSLYVLGVFLSIDLLFAGIAWISLGMTLKSQKLAFSPVVPSSKTVSR